MRQIQLPVGVRPTEVVVVSAVRLVLYLSLQFKTLQTQSEMGHALTSIFNAGARFMDILFYCLGDEIVELLFALLFDPWLSSI